MPLHENVVLLEATDLLEEVLIFLFHLEKDSLLEELYYPNALFWLLTQKGLA
jgi:hypothetical protein